MLDHTCRAIAMIESLFAILIVTACGVMLVRLGVGERRRYRLDAFMRAAWRTTVERSASLWHWRRSRTLAKQGAEDALRRARQGVDRDGNVIRPDAFRSPRKPH